MQQRMTQPAVMFPEAMKALLAVQAVAVKTGVPRQLFTLLELRVSQINGCSYCVDMHAKELKKVGESDERIYAVAAWRDAPFFTDAERAALELAEAVTRLADRPDPVPDEVWDEARRHFDEAKLAGLLLGIANINVWNRLNVATRQVAGQAHR